MEFRLHSVLKQRGISIKSFAEKIGVKPNSLPITVAFSPSLQNIQRYANELNIPAMELIYDPGCFPTPAYDGKDHTDQTPLDEMVQRRIREVMAEKHLTFKMIADVIGMSVQSVSQTVKRNKMSLSTLEKLATGMGVEVRDLISEPKTGDNGGMPDLFAQMQYAEQDAPEPSDEASELLPRAETEVAPNGAYIVLPTLANGLIDLSQVVMIDTPDGKVAALPMSAVRII